MKDLVEKMDAALKQYRIIFGTESEMQQHLAAVFDAAGISFKREKRISARDRLDFWIPDFADRGFAVEAKIGGGDNAHFRQIKRYNDHPIISGCILISTRRHTLPETISGKPVAEICIGGNRL